MNQKFETIIKYLIGIEKGEDSLSKINIPEQFCMEKKDKPAIAKNLNAAFLIALSGKSHSLYKQALHYLNDFQTHPTWKKIVSFYQEGLDHIHSEITDRCLTDVSFKEQLNDLCAWISKPENRKQRKETIEKIWQMFFPEGVALSESKNRPEKIYQLRQKRKVKITKLNPAPITKPAEELLFTSNILVTLPFSDMDIDNLPIISSLRPRLKEIRQEPQVFWYDHPIPIGIDPKQNEAIHGLTGLENAVTYEIQKGNATENTKLTCVLSVSVTHKGLHDIIKKYLEEEIKKQKNMPHLEVYLFTETDTQKLIEEILVPIVKKEMGSKNYNLLYEIFGVDGEYGRHYSFLKAISAFWQVFINPKIKGTFKIDLDQVFPQEKLVEQTGISAFEHFKTPLWGAEGLDYEGNKVVLGMLAGALVNKEHIEHSLFYPDVDFPPQDVAADEIIFLSRLPQALSTAAEMMTRYTDDILDGRNQVIQRVHVTGGTTGILVNALRKYRPFVPTFIGRAEDQAYILSMLFSGSPYLRYLHKDGLIMRHDKKAFAREVIKAAA
ncbi:MAG: hypothetical protein ACE5HI_19815, partial [bacterium]